MHNTTLAFLTPAMTCSCMHSSHVILVSSFRGFDWTLWTTPGYRPAHAPLACHCQPIRVLESHHVTSFSQWHHLPCTSWRRTILREWGTPWTWWWWVGSTGRGGGRASTEGSSWPAMMKMRRNSRSYARWVGGTVGLMCIYVGLAQAPPSKPTSCLVLLNWVSTHSEDWQFPRQVVQIYNIAFILHFLYTDNYN